jgi:hypothetical protein
VFLAPFFYAALGTGMQSHVGPLAIVSLLTGQVVSSFGLTNPADQVPQ